MADNDTTEHIDDTEPTGVGESTGAGDSATEPADGDEGKLGNAGKSALEQERRARREADRARRESDRARKELEKKLQEFQDRDKSETEKALTRAQGAEARVDGLLQRAVRAEVRALASTKFEDPEDAIAFLNPSSYADDEGEIDADQIQADLADLLERKPHLAKKLPVEPDKRRPAPDRTQASSANASRTASPEEMFEGFLKAQRK